MENYVTQLIEDIESAMDHVPRPYIPSQGLDLRDVPTPEEEERTAQVRELEELTGISKDQLPPGEKLTDDQCRGYCKPSTKCYTLLIGALFSRTRFPSVFNILPYAKTLVSSPK